MRLAGPIIIAVLLVDICFAQAPATTPNDIPPARWTDRTNLGFHGPAHCVLVTTQEIATDPRDQRDLTNVSIDPGTPWMCFSQDGWIVEDGGVKEGKPINAVKYQRGPDGERLGNSENEREVKRRDGNVESAETYSNDRLIVRRKTWLDSQDQPTRTETSFGNDFQVISTTDYEGSAAISDTQEFQGDTLTGHYRLTIDAETGLVDKAVFNLDGSIIAEIRSVKDQLTYASHVPGIKNMTNTIGTIWCDHDKQTVSFNFAPDGDVLKYVQHHNGRYGNLEPDDVEVTDSRGVIVQRIQYHYQRDAHSNWISRVVLVQDPKTGAMMEVARNHRVLTYYDTSVTE